MKKVLKQIAKALGYFAVYFTASNLVTLIITGILGYVKGKEYGQAGLSYDEGMALVLQDQASVTGICLLLGAILTLITYFIIEKVKKTSLAKETDMKPVSAKHMGLTVIGAIGAMFFMNFIMSILPIPSELTGDLANGMSKLTAYPFWQAILANAIFVPIMEEVLFRGYIFSRLGKAMPSAVAALISSAVFGLCHGSLLWMVWAFVLGMVICVARIKTVSIIPGIVFHIIMNTYAMIVAYFPIYNNLTETVMYILTAVGGVLMAVYIVAFLMDKGASKEPASVKVTSAKV